MQNPEKYAFHPNIRCKNMQTYHDIQRRNMHLKDMLRRKINDKLLAWKISPRKMTLLLNGAHQVGKTFNIRQFAVEHYPHHIYLVHW